MPLVVPAAGELGGAAGGHKPSNTSPRSGPSVIDGGPSCAPVLENDSLSRVSIVPWALM
jgi:hypothetical protein